MVFVLNVIQGLTCTKRYLPVVFLVNEITFPNKLPDIYRVRRVILSLESFTML
jgi:hypothetical protein